MVAHTIGQMGGNRKSPALRIAAGTLLMCVLSACGGESVGSDGGIVTVPTPSSTSTPSSTPTPTPSSSGQIASVDLATIPIGINDTVGNFKVTNSGLYMKVSYGEETKPDAIFKLRGSPSFSDAWYLTVPNDSPSGSVTDFAPVNPYAETRTELTFYWAGRDFSTVGLEKWGLHTVNSGGVSLINEERSFGNYGIELVASGARGGVASSRPWVLWYQPSTVGNTGLSIYQDDGVYTKTNSIADRFSNPAKPQLPSVATHILSHPNNAELFVGAGNKLFLYSPSSLIRSWTLPDGIMSDMMWADDALYFGHGGRIYKTDGTTLRSIAEVLGAGYGVDGSFCISGGEIFLPTGEAIDIRTSTRRNWIKKGQLSASQASAAQQLEIAALSSGIFCSSYASGTTLYIVGRTNKSLRVVKPVSR